MPATDETLAGGALQEWLGHSTPAATQHYAKITPTLAKSYADVGYFARNLSAIEGFV